MRQTAVVGTSTQAVPVDVDTPLHGRPTPSGAGLGGRRVPLARRRVELAHIVAAVAIVLTGMRYELTLNVTLGTLVALALAPVWLPVFARFRGATTLVLVCVACLPLGVWLTLMSAETRGTSDRLTVGSSVLLLNFVLGLGILLWGRTLMPTPAVALLYAVGMIAAAPGSGRAGESPWRFAYGVPVSIALLAAAWWWGRRLVEVITALGLAAVTAVASGRSMFAMLLLAAIVVAWQAPFRPSSGRRSRLRGALFLAAAVAALYNLAQSLALEGYLGERAQERTISQIASAGSVIAGGRPEIGATVALVGHEPWGFGSGSRLNSTDLLIAKAGMTDLGYDPNNGYVERYMFGGGIELHSFWADLWSDFGIAGAVLGALLAWHLIAHLSGALSQHAASALVVFLVVQNVWNLLFSPRYGSYTFIVLAVALVLVPAVRSPDGRARTGTAEAPRGALVPGVRADSAHGGPAS